MRNTTDVTSGKPIAVLLQSISGVSAINPLVAFYDIHGGKREVLFFYLVPDTTRDCPVCKYCSKTDNNNNFKAFLISYEEKIQHKVLKVISQEHRSIDIKLKIPSNLRRFEGSDEIIVCITKTPSLILKTYPSEI
jgi:hypothetical protein